ncbi:MAG: hypothetical protein M3067_15920 [Chloroflexota bacterium]|nr:hypothetical protein [Chloroflexota bacterium]
MDFVRDPADAPFDASALRGWCDADGRGRAIVGYKLALFTRYPCGAGHAAILAFGQPLGAPIDGQNRHDYVQDPRNEFLGENWIAEPYQGHATLPTDAAYTGWTNGNIDLWISPSDVDRAIYVVRGKVVERWPRAVPGWGVIDCN